MEFTSEEGEQRYAALVRAAAETVVGLDFDGTLAPIVDDPAAAHIHPDAGRGPGRPRRSRCARSRWSPAARRGRRSTSAGLEGVGNAIGDAGKELYLFGQYGNERWTSTNRRVISPRPPHGLATFTARAAPAAAPRTAPRTRTSRRRGWRSPCTPAGCADPERAFESLLPALRGAGRRATTSSSSPGKQVIEVRSAGMHKGLVVERLVDELDAGGFVFVGDDLGDMEAFEAVAALAQGRPAHPPGLLRLRRGERAGRALRRGGPRPRRRPRPAPPAHRRRRRPPGLMPWSTLPVDAAGAIASVASVASRQLAQTDSSPLIVPDSRARMFAHNERRNRDRAREVEPA